ncbi:MAG: DNA polymerase III subunit delta' [Erythrobacter sp.]
MSDTPPERPASDVWPNHAKAWHEWRAALAGQRMHHGWIVAGKSGLGKRDFASAAARELVDSGTEGAGMAEHPDIIVLTHGPKDKKAEKAAADGKPFERARSIRVDQVRAMQRRLTTRPTLGDRRVVIVDPADDMETGASNALLKSLEEPPAGTYFILVAHRPARLLPTIRSRCRMLRIPILTDRQIDAMLASADATASDEAREAAVRAAEGSFGTARRFLEQDLAPVSGLVRNLVARGDRDLKLRGEFARLVGPRADRDRVTAVIELAQGIVAQSARHAADNAQRARLADVHADLVALARDMPTYNFDTGLLVLEIGTLLTRAAPASEPAHV